MMWKTLSVMSVILPLKVCSSTLSIDFVPPMSLESDATYGLALFGFESYNSISNIKKGFRENKEGVDKIIELDSNITMEAICNNRLFYTNDFAIDETPRQLIY